jgi:hypothetical protein
MRDEIVTESEVASTKDEAPQIYIWAKVSGTIYDYDSFSSAASLPPPTPLWKTEAVKHMVMIEGLSLPAARDAGRSR